MLAAKGGSRLLDSFAFRLRFETQGCGFGFECQGFSDRGLPPFGGFKVEGLGFRV